MSTDVMDDVDYENANFNKSHSELYHPLWMTEGHYIYHLLRDETGHLSCDRDSNGDPLCSPRLLTHLCMRKLVCDPALVFQHGARKDVPGGIYPAILSEAIYQRELHTIHYLISTWPNDLLDLRSVIPVEDMLEHNLLTTPVDSTDGLTILDSMIYGLLDQKSVSRLKVVTFTGFKNDRKMCRELLRLPLLWVSPDERKLEYIHEVLNRTFDITEDKTQRYLNRISCIYKNMDPYIKHGKTFGPITIILDCKINIDDIPIGLAFQNESPFRFACQRVWMKSIPEIDLPLNAINRVLELRDLTHLEFEDQELCSDFEKLQSFKEGIILLPNVTSLSFPNTIHVGQIDGALETLAETLGKISTLRKLNLASCNLKDNLGTILSSLSQNIQYLNLRDCRLAESDVTNLSLWNKISGLLELNISRNNIQYCMETVIEILYYVPQITCFSISYCSMTHIQLTRICQKCLELKNLKIIGIQSFTPPPIEDIEEILLTVSLMEKIQKCLILPDAFAFPGGDSLARLENREIAIDACETFLQQAGRLDIVLE